MFCKHCGVDMGESKNFCPVCGGKNIDVPVMQPQYENVLEMMQYAGFMDRVKAALIDGVLIIVANMLLSFLLPAKAVSAGRVY